jgi:hypothetical protein
MGVTAVGPVDGGGSITMCDGVWVWTGVSTSGVVECEGGHWGLQGRFDARDSDDWGKCGDAERHLQGVLG